MTDDDESTESDPLTTCAICGEPAADPEPMRAFRTYESEGGIQLGRVDYLLVVHTDCYDRATPGGRLGLLERAEDEVIGFGGWKNHSTGKVVIEPGELDDDGNPVYHLGP